ncbi:putative MFS family arabinose efflux permease [Herbihabitans rhizosphaerae]|uniref:Putative MFS family arabinose efflux permease n=1 Tax=Herbihabitans rhizosphaerae TaxID=1872711 RepID=A0A4Q7L514_9PSEU|nr:MFS transporter [Herbihabitans rhizosphaerae]RZS44344.1 putative MFS family arabinose efflux permease [Herbihabitans rhizosphaerae]
MTSRAARRRFLVLTALRWLPAGFTLPVLVLLPLERGLTLAEVGMAFAVQGFVVFFLELPTGGLSDSLGRKPVLLMAGVVGVASHGLMVVAHGFGAFVVVYALQGVYRALDSGPLDAWYVDAALAADPNAEIDRGMSAAGVVIGLGMGAGALLAGGLIAWTGALVLPVIVAVAVKLANIVVLSLLLKEIRPDHRPRGSVRDVPRVIGEALGLLRRSRILLALICVELFWGFGMVTFEMLMPVRLAEVTANPDTAASLLGPVTTAAWFASSLGAAVVGVAGRRFGVAYTAAALRILHGITVVAMGLFAGPVGLIAAFLACYMVHGAANPPHMTLLHSQVDSAHRSTVVSLNSLVAQPAGALGGIVLTALAAGTSVSTAIIVGAVVLALAAPLYLPAARVARSGNLEDTQPPMVATLPQSATAKGS